MTDVLYAFRQFNEQQKDELKRTRLLMFTVAASMGAKVKSPQELLPIDGDEEIAPQVTDDEALAMLRAMADAELKQNNGRVSQN